MPKNYRKTKPISGTIFDKASEDDSTSRQRRCGFLYLHGVNPATVAKGSVDVESLGQGKVRVYYEAIYLPPGQDTWPVGVEGHGPGIPSGIWCDHGGYNKRHKAKQIRSFDAFLSEVL